MASHAARRDWRHALAAFADSLMAGVPPQSSALAPIIQATGVDGASPEISRWIFRDVHAAVNLRPCTAAHHALLRGYASGGRWESALAHVLAVARVVATRPTGAQRGTANYSDADVRRALTLPGADESERDAGRHDGRGDAAAAALARPPTRVDNFMVRMAIQACTAQAAWAPALALVRCLRAPAATHYFRDLTPVASGGSVTGVTVSTPLARDAAPLFEWDERTVTDLMRCLERSARWREAVALQAACERQHLPLAHDACDSVVRACHFAGQHHAAVLLTARMVDLKIALSERTCRLAIRSAEADCAALRAHATSWALAVSLFGALASSGCRRGPETYAAPMRACAAAGQWEHALVMYGEMRRDGISCSEHTLEAAVTAKVAAAPAEEALALLIAWEMRIGAATARSTRMYNAALSACVRDGRLQTLMRLRGRMRRREVPTDIETHKVMIHAEHMTARWAAVVNRFNALRQMVDRERAAATAKGYTLRPEDHVMEPELVRVVLEACEALGLGDPAARTAAGACVAALQRADGVTKDGDAGSSPVPLLEAAGAAASQRVGPPMAAAGNIGLAGHMREALRKLQRATVSDIRTPTPMGIETPPPNAPDARSDSGDTAGVQAVRHAVRETQTASYFDPAHDVSRAGAEESVLQMIDVPPLRS
jgi:pentatricopeptide repeat protein